MFESVRSVRAGWIGFGWFIAVALASLVLLGMIWLGMIRADAPTEGLGVALALLVGFFLAGFFVGSRVNAAPILHGVGMGLMSLIAWFALNLFAGGATDADAWSSIPVGVALGLLMLQTVAAIVGTRAGVRFARRAASLAG
jgi:hypothetical protein